MKSHQKIQYGKEIFRSSPILYGINKEKDIQYIRILGAYNTDTRETPLKNSKIAIISINFNNAEPLRMKKGNITDSFQEGVKGTQLLWFRTSQLPCFE